MFPLLLQVRIEEGRITFPSAPEDIGAAAERDGRVERPSHLGRGMREDERVRIRRGAVRIPRMAEEVRRAPEKRDSGLFLERGSLRYHAIQVLLSLRRSRSLGSDIAIVKAIEVDTELFEQLEGCVHRRLGGDDSIRFPSPRSGESRAPECIGAGSAQRMPVANGETKMLGHRLACDHARLVIVTERKGILRFRTLVGNGLDDLGKIARHVMPPGQRL